MAHVAKQQWLVGNGLPYDGNGRVNKDIGNTVEQPHLFKLGFSEWTESVLIPQQSIDASKQLTDRL